MIKITWRPQVLILSLALTGLAGLAMYLGHTDLAGMAVVAIAGALGKLVD